MSAKSNKQLDFKESSKHLLIPVCSSNKMLMSATKQKQCFYHKKLLNCFDCYWNVFDIAAAAIHRNVAQGIS